MYRKDSASERNPLETQPNLIFIPSQERGFGAIGSGCILPRSMSFQSIIFLASTLNLLVLVGNIFHAH